MAEINSERPNLKLMDVESSKAAGRSVRETTILGRISRFLALLIFFCLLAVIVLTAIPYGTADPWWVGAFECAVFGIAGLWFLRILLGGSVNLRGLSLVLPLFAMTAYAFIQIVHFGTVTSTTGGLTRVAPRTLSIDAYQTYLTAFKTLALTVFLALLLIQTNSARRLRWLVRTVIGLGFAAALFGILRQFLQSENSTKGFVLPYLFGGVGYGQFISPNTFSYLMEMSLALVAGLILSGAVRRGRLLVHIAIGSVIWAALVLSNSRGGILGLTCQAIFLLYVSMSWYSARRAARNDRAPGWLEFVRTSRFVRVLVIGLIIAILLGGVLWMGGNNLASKQTSNSEVGESTTRRDIWRATLRLIQDYPLTGVGFGAYPFAIPQYRVGAGLLRLEQAHNDYLDLVANGGLVALAIAACFLAMWIWRSRAPLRSRDLFRRAAALGAVAGILDVAVHSLVDFGLQVTSIAVVFIVLVVISVADERVEERTRRRSVRH